MTRRWRYRVMEIFNGGRKSLDWWRFNRYPTVMVLGSFLAGVVFVNEMK